MKSTEQSRLGRDFLLGRGGEGIVIVRKMSDLPKGALYNEYQL